MIKNKISIGLTGPSGTGKSTIMNTLCITNNFEVVNVPTADMMNKHGFKTHEEIINASVVNPKKSADFQLELFDTRYDLFMQKIKEDSINFITDRIPLDTFVYLLLHDSKYISDGIMKEKRLKLYNCLNCFSHIIYIPANSIPLENNDVRILSPEFQEMVGYIFKGVIADWEKCSTKSAKVLTPIDCIERMCFINNIINGK